MFLCFVLASAKTLSGLLEWECKTDAVEALTALNHYQIRVPSKYSCHNYSMGITIRNTDNYLKITFNELGFILEEREV